MAPGRNFSNPDGSPGARSVAGASSTGRAVGLRGEKLVLMVGSGHAIENEPSLGVALGYDHSVMLSAHVHFRPY